MYYFILGLSSLAKVLIAMEGGVIPANLHYNTPNADIPELSDGTLQVVSENTPFEGGYVAMNSFGFGGSNVHVLLKSFPKVQNQIHPASDMKRLCTFSGRTEEGVQGALAEMAKLSTDVSAHSLMQEVVSTPLSTHPYRGYTILNDQTKTPEVKVRFYHVHNKTLYC